MPRTSRQLSGILAMVVSWRTTLTDALRFHFGAPLFSTEL